MTINGITFDMLWTYLFVAVALCGIVTIVLGAVEKIAALLQRKRKPMTDARTDIMTMLTNDKHRLDAHDVALSEQTRRLDKLESRAGTMEQGQKVQCKALMALLDHELHNGNANQMEEASKEINDYLLYK